MSRILIRNGRLIDPASGLDESGDVAVADGRIVGLGGTIEDFTPEQRIDADGQWVIPGLIDLAARLREPGASRKADIASESRAAAAAGITTLVMPPDTTPVMDTASVIELVSHRADSAGGARVTLTLPRKPLEADPIFDARRTGGSDEALPEAAQ